MTVVNMVSNLGDEKIIDGLNVQVGKRIIDVVNSQTEEGEQKLCYNATGLDFINIYSRLSNDRRVALRADMEAAYVDGMRINDDLKESIADVGSKAAVNRRWIVILMSIIIGLVISAFSYIVILISLASHTLPPVEWLFYLAGVPAVLILFNSGLSNKTLRDLLKIVKAREDKVKSVKRNSDN